MVIEGTIAWTMEEPLNNENGMYCGNGMASKGPRLECYNKRDEFKTKR